MGGGIVAGKIAFVTGAGSGIGRAVCQVLAREGAKVIAADQNGIAAQETQGLLSNVWINDHISVTVDVSMAESVNMAISDVIKHYSRPPSVVVNSAGITRDNFLLKMDEKWFQKVIDVNLKGTFLVVQTAVKAMIDAKISEGSIINIASIVGKTGNIGQCNYSASKAGVEAFTKTAAKEFGQFGIRCNAVVPGFIRSPMTDAVPEKVLQKIIPFIAVRRMGKPEEVAEVIAFLASDRSSYINGASIEVTGG
ncbi:Estradiol 17-beta-dehydrogenase 8 [Cryptotermes secundus]|uniref:(3R)-3-hydroxyacyl-CoA dehydrogenase n=1 Tax=Cryptotermes secundus TaxID=105785 RepID=A0A2J7PQF3_9NEOP|nr:estradiol 17-beta-dehydrogenase 8 isoform X2 [Cryptotermes secundus]PNF18567.1 Estradiol 17-beta-dehydrogenase 8 [Cryptotermes secundus]